MTDTRLRLTLLGGYLGSGKTTWLRHQLHVGAFGPRVHVVVNEAAEVPVDDALLAGAAGRVSRILTLAVLGFVGEPVEVDGRGENHRASHRPPSVTQFG